MQQKKVGEVGNDRWIGNLRRSFAARTNAQLEKERVERRVDPRRHADMGIPGDPQEHLGTRQAAAETRGIVTPVGRANEERQSHTIEAIIDQKHETERAAIAKQVEVWRTRSEGRPAASSSSFVDALDKFSASLMTAAALDRLSAQLRHGVDRAGSRATHVRRANDQLVRAIDADSAAGSVRERRERAGLVKAAADYLDWLGVTLADEHRLIAECEAEAERRRIRAAILEAQLTAAVSVAPALVEIKPAVTGPLPAVGNDSAPRESAGDSLDRWITRIEVTRPYIRRDRSGFSVAGHEAVSRADTDKQVRLATLHRRQQDEISRIADHVRARPTAMAFDIVDGRRRFKVRGLDPELAKAFVRYRDGDELIAVIEAVLNPDRGTRTRLGAGVHQRQSTVESPATSDQKVETGAALPPSEIPIEVPLTCVTATPDGVAAPIPTPTGPPASTTGYEPDPPLPDPKRVARDLIAARIPLTIAEDHAIDRAALRAGKVDERIIENVRCDPLLIIRSADQIEVALARIRAHVAHYPDDLALRPGGHVLEGDAPAELVALAQFHSEAPRCRQQLDVLYRGLHPVAPPTESTPPAAPDLLSPIERHPERFSTIEPDLALRAEAKRYALEQAGKRSDLVERLPGSDPVPSVRQMPVSEGTGKDADIVHGEAARRAAQRAAVQRGS